MTTWDSISLQVRNAIKRCICAMRGQPNGIAPLDESGQLPAQYLPPSAAQGGSLTNSITSYRVVGNNLIDIVDQYTGEQVSLEKSTNRLDGPAITDADVDNIIYFKVSGNYYTRVFDFLNVKWFGATGDGVTNDRAAIQAALNVAVIIKYDLFFPAGSYQLNSFFTTDNGAIINFPDVPAYSIRMFGERGTKLTTSLTRNGSALQSQIFSLYRNSTNLTIDSIFFENLHGITTDRTYAMYVIGTSTNGISGLTIRNCRFEGFSQDILLNGVVNPIIENCIFAAPKGRDNAQSNNEPAVFINFVCNGNGIVINPTVRNCIANGYTGSNISTTVSKALKDGFIYGNSIGGRFYNNDCKNLGVESIFIRAYINSINALPVRIYNNTIDCTPPISALRYDGGTPLTTYGIRSEAFLSIIEENTIVNASYGILQDAQSGSINYNFSQWLIKNNTISLTSGSNYRLVFGINQTGFSGAVKTLNAIIKNNTLIFNTVSLAEDFSAISSANSDKSYISQNDIFINSLTKNGFNANYLTLSRANNLLIENEYLDETLLTAINLIATSPVSTYSYAISSFAVQGIKNKIGPSNYATYAQFQAEIDSDPTVYHEAYILNDEVNNRTSVYYKYVPNLGVFWIAALLPS